MYHPQNTQPLDGVAESEMLVPAATSREMGVIEPPQYSSSSETTVVNNAADADTAKRTIAASVIPLVICPFSI